MIAKVSLKKIILTLLIIRHDKERVQNRIKFYLILFFTSTLKISKIENVKL